MMVDEQMPATNGESAKLRDAQVLHERVEGALESGDYKIARQLRQRIIELVPDSDLGREAAQGLRALSPDPVHIYSGLFAASLLLIGWLISLL